MAKAGQYYNGTDWIQAQLDVADYTTTSNIVCSFFYTIKDKFDNLYILCFTNGSGWDDGIPFIKITKDGIKTVTKVSSYNDECRHNSNISLCLSKDQLSVFATFTDSLVEGLKSLNTDMTTTSIRGTQIFSNVSKFAIYKDLYIWVASGTMVGIYDYTTKAELASVSLSSPTALTMVLNTENDLYIQYKGSDTTYNQLLKLSFNGLVINTTTVIANEEPSSVFKAMTNFKQLLLNPFGDLIILTNSGTASTLLKYTTAGVQIGTAITLANPSYNLNIGKLKDDGSYKLYYQTALKTFSVNNTTAHAEIPALVNHVEIRETGNTGYGSNYTGQQPSVYA